jgi:hypothetical protein
VRGKYERRLDVGTAFNLQEFLHLTLLQDRIP